MRQYFTLFFLMLAVSAKAQVSDFVTTNSPVCLGDSLKLTSMGSTNDTYLWTGPGGFTSTLQNPVIADANYSDTGVYTLVKNGVNTYYTASVIVNPSVMLSGVTDSQTIILGSSVQLNSAGALFYTWIPSNNSLNNPSINNPIATPSSSTTYKVVGMNEWGCRDSAFVFIGVNYPNQIVIPTAFTPNNDGHNDIFRIINPNGFQLAEFKVINKWGQTIYNNANNILQGWDGTFNGVPQDIGTYSYIITVVSPDNTKKTFNGTVTLIR